MAGYGHKPMTLPSHSSEGNNESRNLQRLLTLGGLLQCREVSAMGLWCYLTMMSLAFGFRGLFIHSERICLIVTRGVSGHTQVGKTCLFRGPIIAQLGSQPRTYPPSSQPALWSVYFFPSLQELQFTVSILFRLSRGSYRHKAENHHCGNTGGFFASLTLMLILSLTV